MVILSSFMLGAVVINFIVILITLAKLSRQMDSTHKILKMMEKRITEEDHFIIKISEIVTRVEKGMQAKKGDIEWKG
ncbi:MAG: hypothetical protein WC637_14410 [Victivallales bacterium]|jgi:hypothetical protein